MPDGSHAAWVLSAEALDSRLAFVGTSGSGKTYAAKGYVERLLATAARLCIVDPLGVWWGLRSSADGEAPGFPVLVLGGAHADVPISEHDGKAIARLVATRAMQWVIDLSELGSAASRRRFMASFCDELYERNRETLHLVLDEADLWAPQKPQPDQAVLQGKISEIVRRGRVRGFIPWVIVQRTAVLDKDVLSQADVLIAMKLTASQDRAAIGGWIEGQADREEGRAVLADLPSLRQGDGYVWAPSFGILARTHFPPITTFDSSRTPKRGERIAGPSAAAPVDAAEVLAALKCAVSQAKSGSEETTKAIREAHAAGVKEGRRLERAAVASRIEELERAVRAAMGHLAPVATAAPGSAPAIDLPRATTPEIAPAPRSNRPTSQSPKGGAELRILAVLAGRHPARLTEAQWATLAGMKRTGGTWQTYKSRLRVAGLIHQVEGFWLCTAIGLERAGSGATAPMSKAEVMATWRKAVGGAGKVLDALASSPGGLTRSELAGRLGMTESGGTFQTYLSRVRSNGLVLLEAGRLHLSEVLR